MSINSKIFKAYDIRGLYPSEINEETAYLIGRATVDEFSLRTIAVGRDARSHSPALFEAFAKGAMEQGADIIDLGLLTTPMVYFASWNIPSAEAVVSLTASHNPPEYNGMKISLRDAVPVGEKTGLANIRDRVIANNFTAAGTAGTLTTHDIKPAYYEHFQSFAHLGETKFSVVIDTANAMGVLELPIFQTLAAAGNLNITYLYDSLEHPFSAHEANPLNTETLDELRAKVKETGADLGIAFDGDADRVGFVDERGEIIPMYFITGLIAKTLLRDHPGATVLYDLRSSTAVKEVIEEAGGKPQECVVGHANIKRQMREVGAIFAGELSGHYYFAENSLAEAGSLPALYLLNLMAETGQPISALVKTLERYYHSGEINSEVEDKDTILATLKERYADGAAHELDGLKITYPDWWFNVRGSNTEPLLRLNLEANTPELLAKKQAELLAIIRG
jgi:phosphomannomutase